MLEVAVGFMVELLTAYLQQLMAETVASRGFKNRSELLGETSRAENGGLSNVLISSIRSMDSFRCFARRSDAHRLIYQQRKPECLYTRVDASAAAMSHRPNSSCLATFSVLGERNSLSVYALPFSIRSPLPLHPERTPSSLLKADDEWVRIDGR